MKEKKIHGLFSVPQLNQGWWGPVDPGLSEAASRLWHPDPALLWAFKGEGEHEPCNSPVPLAWRVFAQLHLFGWRNLSTVFHMLAALLFYLFFNDFFFLFQGFT